MVMQKWWSTSVESVQKSPPQSLKQPRKTTGHTCAGIMVSKILWTRSLVTLPSRSQILSRYGGDVPLEVRIKGERISG